MPHQARLGLEAGLHTLVAVWVERLWCVDVDEADLLGTAGERCGAG